MNHALSQAMLRSSAWTVPPVVVMAVIALLVLGGCEGPAGEEDSDPTATPSSNANVKLRILVVDDAAMAAAIERQTGEWRARVGGELEVAQVTSAALLESETLKADAVLYPQNLMGHLATQGLILPVRPKLLEREGYDAADVFELVQHRVLTWGDQPMGVPLGSPVMVLYYRADLLKHLDRQPPQTWKEYSELASLLSDRENLGKLAPPEDQPWHGCLEPVREGWAAITLLARATAYAKHRNRLAVLFDLETMAPQIASRPFERALEEMKSAGLDSAPAMDPAEVRLAIHSGHCGMALTWPNATTGMPKGEKLDLAIAELPGAKQSYNVRDSSWQAVEGDRSKRVPLLGIAGRVGSVTSTTRNVPTVLRFLAWLSSEEVSSQVSAASSETTLFRRSHLRTSSIWMEKGWGAAASRDYATALQVALQSPEWLSVVRIPQAQAYLTALDQPVRESLAGKATSNQALESAAKAWQAITEKAGRETQQQAYLRSLGL